MALALKDRVKETTIVVGTGTATLLGSSIGFQPFSVVGNGNTTYYCIADQFGSNWEVGIGTYTASGNTLARTTVLSSSNADALVAFTAGIKDVFVTYPSSKGLWKDASGNAIGLGTPASGVVTNLTGTASININGTVGATTATTGAFTTLSASSTVTLSGGTANGVAYLNASKVLTSGSGLVFDGTTLNFGGTAQRITGDFSNATITNKLSFQSSTTNGGSYPQVLPNGTNTNSGFLAFNNADPTNAGYLGLLSTSTDARVTSGITGTGTYLPITFYTSGSEKVRIDTSGNVGIGTSNPTNWTNGKLVVAATSSSPANIYLARNGNAAVTQPTTYGTQDAGFLSFYQGDVGVGFQRYFDIVSDGSLGTANSNIRFWTNTSGSAPTVKMTIDASGNLLVGTTSLPIASTKVGISGASASALGLLSYVNTGSATKKWSEGPDSAGNFVVFNDASAGAYINYGGTSWTAYSDERLKTDLVPIENGLEKVNSLRSVTGRYLTDEEGKSRSFLIAQDVQKVLPEAVSVQDDELGTLGVAYTEVIPLLVASIKELKAIIDTQQEQINSLLGK
jgi:hypothetical protein